MEVFLLSVLIVGLAIGGIAIKMFFKPGATFTKTCGSKFDPQTGKPIECSCHSQVPEDCKN